MKYLKIVLPIILSISLFSLFILFLPPNYDPGGRDYLLSAISQGLAATFALVFTISFVAAQLSTKYSQRMLARVFSRSTIFFMSFFIICIIFPLVVLKYPKDILVDISVILMAICLILLIPYFLSFKEKLSPEKFLSELGEEARKYFNREEKLPNEIKTIDNIIMSAYAFRDYDTFEKGIDEIAKTGIYVGENRKKKEHAIEEKFGKKVEELDWGIGDEKECADEIERIDNLIEEVFKRINKIGEGTINDPRAPFSIVDVLKNRGQEAAAKQMEKITYQMIDILGDIGSAANQLGLEDVEFESLLGLQAMGFQAILYRLKTSLSTARIRIGENAIACAQNKSDRLTKRYAEVLTIFITQTSQHNMEDAIFGF